MSDDALTECPACAGRINRVIYPVGVVFKGSGWYINDSRESRNGKKSTENGSEKAEKTESKGDDAKVEKKESKPKAAEAKSAAD
jgi:hypothetical protein